MLMWRPRKGVKFRCRNFSIKRKFVDTWGRMSGFRYGYFLGERKNKTPTMQLMDGDSLGTVIMRS